MKRTVNPWVYWAPRILTIVFLCFLALMSLDVISAQLSFWQILGGLVMHNIPTLLLFIILIITWKYEIVGGAAFILAGLASIIMLSRSEAWPTTLLIAGTAFLIGVLFLMNWSQKKVHP